VRNDSYAPGDVATIHPLASSIETEAFLDMMNWGDIADTPLEIGCAMQGMLFIPFFHQKYYPDWTSDQSLPDHLPRISTLRTIFARYVDFKAVPRRSFFQYLRYLTTDEQEQEKLDDFLSEQVQ
jgi:sulfite reductase alpha subunit-like flavoprotein